MQANPRNLDAIFNSQLRYVVPMFQRLYVWQETPQWQTLWEDIAEKAELQLRGGKANAHYLGALIIEGVKPKSPREVKRFLIIDGQQRLTTLQLVFCAFRDHVRLKGWKTLDRTTSRYLENADPDVMERPNEEIFKLWPTTLNRQIFADIVSAGTASVIGKKYPLVWIKRRKKPEPRSALVNAYFYFSNKISAWIAEAATRHEQSEENCAFKLLQSIQQDFCVVEIALSEGDDSQEIFYSLNSQGRPLSQSDLLRSLVFMRAEKEKADRDEIFDQYWSRFETDFWSAEIRRAGRTYSRLDLGLRYFLMAKTGTLVDARRVNEEYRAWISATPPKYPSVRDELADLSQHCDLIRNYESLPLDLPSSDFRRVLRDLDVSTAIPLVMFLELEAKLPSDQKQRCFKMIESFIIRRAFTGEETKEYNKLFVDVIAALKSSANDRVLEALSDKLRAGGGSTRHWPNDGQIIEAAISRPVFKLLRTPTLRLILERLELFERGKKSEDHSIPDGLHIEHVLPQAWGEHWPLGGAAIPPLVVGAPYLLSQELSHLADPIRARNERLHTLGNLTLLNKHLNPAAGHGSFELKLSEYRHSVLRLNRYFDRLKEWDETAIAERAKLLGANICKIWPQA